MRGQPLWRRYLRARNNIIVAIHPWCASEALLCRGAPACGKRQNVLPQQIVLVRRAVKYRRDLRFPEGSPPQSVVGYASSRGHRSGLHLPSLTSQRANSAYVLFAEMRCSPFCARKPCLKRKLFKKMLASTRVIRAGTNFLPPLPKGGLSEAKRWDFSQGVIYGRIFLCAPQYVGR